MSDNGSGSLSYPTKHMVDVASQMCTNANNALKEHDAAWSRIQNYVHGLFGFMQGPIFAVLNPYEQHLRKSYQWQIDCGNAIIGAANLMDETNTSVSNSFQGFH
jgi:hypothetical protein